MGLQIIKSLQSGGQPFSNAYGRIEAEIVSPGDKIRMTIDYYYSKEKYEVDDMANQFAIDGIPRHGEFAYDRAVDGTDILMLAHTKFKELLVSQVNVPGGDDRPNPFYQEFNIEDIAIVDLV